MHRSSGELLHVYVQSTACEQIHKQAKIDLGQYPAIFGLLPGQYLHVYYDNLTVIFSECLENNEP